MQIKILDSKDNQFYFILVASNGETIATGEMYTTKAKAVYAANLIKKTDTWEIGDFCVRKAAISKKPKP